MLCNIPSPRRQIPERLGGFARVSRAPLGPRHWVPHMISHQNKNTMQAMTTNHCSSCGGTTPQPSPSPAPVSSISPRRHFSTSCVLTITSLNHHRHSSLHSAPFSPGAGGNNIGKNTINIFFLPARRAVSMP